jgi:transposase
MLIKTIIRKTLNVKSHKVVKVTQTCDGIEVYLDRNQRRRLPCGQCGTQAKVRDRLQPRRWKHVPLWGIPVTLVYSPARVACPVCGKIRVENIPWSQGKCRLSTGLIWMLSSMAKLLAWEVVAQMFQVHWNTVKAAVKQAVEYGLKHRQMGTVIYIGIDEISRRKGHVYVTNVYDLTEKRLLWSGEGRDKDTLQRFFQKEGKALKPGLKGVCCDMWEPYLEVLKEELPEVTLVFDKFHLIRHLNQAVDEVRREEAQELKKSNPELLRKTRYLWLKNPENLTDKQRARLGYLEKLNLKINRAYLLKESFRELWNYKLKGWAKRFLTKWFWWATHSRLKPMRDFAWLLRNHQTGILNYFKMKITNGVVEGLNNKAKAVSHRCYGFRTAGTFILALYHCLGKLPEPETMHRVL